MSTALKFPGSPVTVIYRSEQKVGIFKTLDLLQETGGPPWTMHVTANQEERYFPLNSIEQPASNYWTGLSYPGNVGVIIRPTVETDVVNSITAQATMPLPLEVIESLLEPVHVPPTLYAVSEDDGFVATMVLSSDVGMYMRYSGEWHKLNPDVIDGLNVTEVHGGALDMFDQFDRAGQMVNVAAMPRSGDDPPANTGLHESEPTPGVGITAGLSMAVPRVASPDDVPDAIAAAVEDPELRWYVERRIQAMGLDVEVPW